MANRHRSNSAWNDDEIRQPNHVPSHYAPNGAAKIFLAVFYKHFVPNGIGARTTNPNRYPKAYQSFAAASASSSSSLRRQ